MFVLSNILSSQSLALQMETCSSWDILCLQALTQVRDQDVSAFRKAAMSTGKQRFQILRNRDWRQIVWISAMRGCDRNFTKCLGAREQGSTMKHPKRQTRDFCKKIKQVSGFYFPTYFNALSNMEADIRWCVYMDKYVDFMVKCGSGRGSTHGKSLGSQKTSV